MPITIPKKRLSSDLIYLVARRDLRPALPWQRRKPCETKNTARSRSRRRRRGGSGTRRLCTARGIRPPTRTRSSAPPGRRTSARIVSESPAPRAMCPTRSPSRNRTIEAAHRDPLLAAARGRPHRPLDAHRASDFRHRLGTSLCRLGAAGTGTEEMNRVPSSSDAPVQHGDHPTVVPSRMRRPKPCRNFRMAAGSEYCPNGLSYCSERARWTGSLGTANGRRAMMSIESASPRMSTPSQKLCVPSTSVRGCTFSRFSVSCSGSRPRPARGQRCPRPQARPDAGCDLPDGRVRGEQRQRAPLARRGPVSSRCAPQPGGIRGCSVRAHR